MISFTHLGIDYISMIKQAHTTIGCGKSGFPSAWPYLNLCSCPPSKGRHTETCILRQAVPRADKVDCNSELASWDKNSRSLKTMMWSFKTQIGGFKDLGEINLRDNAYTITTRIAEDVHTGVYRLALGLFRIGLLDKWTQLYTRPPFLFYLFTF